MVSGYDARDAFVLVAFRMDWLCGETIYVSGRIQRHLPFGSGVIFTSERVDGEQIRKIYRFGTLSVRLVFEYV